MLRFKKELEKKPLKQTISEIEKVLEQITPDINESNQNINTEDDEIFKKVALLRDEELQMHFQHLKIDTYRSIILFIYFNFLK